MTRYSFFMMAKTRWLMAVGILGVLGTLGALGAMIGSSARAMSSGRTTEVRMEPIWVARPDGTKQCEPASPQPLEDGERELKTAGIQVLRSKHTHDGKMRIQMCGTETGGLNAYEIPGELVEKAQGLGFKRLDRKPD